MLSILNEKKEVIIQAESYEDLCKKIQERENSKLLEGHPEFPGKDWSFVVHSSDRVSKFLKETKEDKITLGMKESVDKGLPLLEICRGNVDEIQELVLTGSFSLEILRAGWISSYCKAHRFTMMDD